ncbi:hypothetical protein D9M71_571110 [compost metagenome]
MRVAIRACLAAENTADDPGTARREQTPLKQWIIRLQADRRAQAIAGKRRITADQILQAATGTAKNQRQVRLGQRRQDQRHTTTAHLRGKAFRPVGLKQLHRRQVQ